MKHSLIKILILIIIQYLLSIDGFSQSREQMVDFYSKTSTLEAAEEFAEGNPSWLSNVYTLTPSDTDRLVLYNAPYMESIDWYDENREMNFLAKYIDSSYVEAWDVQYICFQVEDNDTSDAIITANSVIDKYNSGISFDKLVEEYSCATYANGKLLDIRAGMLMPELDLPLKNAKKGEIIKSFINDYDRYYVVLKISSNKMIKLKQVLVTKYVN